MGSVEILNSRVITPQESNFYNKIASELDVVLDVGAYLTFFKGKNVHYFEPIFERVEDLKQQVNEVGYFNQFGLGRVEEEKILFNRIGSTYDREAKIPDTDMSTTKIQIKPLDSYVRENEIEEISLLKIDVEGAELDVLVGGLESLEKCKYIVFEYSHDTAEAAGMQYEDIQKLLSDVGFEIFDLGVDGDLIDVKRESLRSLYDLFNLVAINKKYK